MESLLTGGSEETLSASKVRTPLERVAQMVGCSKDKAREILNEYGNPYLAFAVMDRFILTNTLLLFIVSWPY